MNAWGYRGPAVGRKQIGEKRVAVLGGSTTWGFGLPAGQDFPAELERLLADDQTEKIKVLNLGFNDDGAYSFTQTLDDYDYLEADLIIFYSGYNDLNGTNNYYNFRHRSPLFGRTGYLPLLPALTVDKMTVWWLQATGQDTRVVFTPPHLDNRNNSSTLRPQLMPAEPNAAAGERFVSSSCSPKWQFYCERIVSVTQLALTKGKRVIIAGEPYLTDDHVEQQSELETLIASRFAGDSHVRYVNLGRVVDLREPSLCWDGMHLTEEGNRRIATALRGPTLEMLH